LDIGCGVAGIDVYLNAHYQEQTPRFYLLDKSQVEDQVFYGFKSHGAFYNSLETAQQMLVSNQIPTERITLLEANEAGEINIGGQIDLAVSLISWGYHYPVRTYLDRVHELLAPGGRLIMDVRRGTGGLEEIQSRFAEVRMISVDKKSDRLLAIK
jgi:hypothetical protein